MSPDRPKPPISLLPAGGRSHVHGACGANVAVRRSGEALRIIGDAERRTAEAERPSGEFVRGDPGVANAGEEPIRRTGVWSFLGTDCGRGRETAGDEPAEPAGVRSRRGTEPGRSWKPWYVRMLRGVDGDATSLGAARRGGVPEEGVVGRRPAPPAASAIVTPEQRHVKCANLTRRFAR
eukprot:COSAG04_NODE_2389_length_4219_cov_3.328883_6_plen_179_part_00